MLGGYYGPGMPALQADSQVAARLLQHRLPALSAHLERLGMADICSLFLPRWLLCGFLNCFPADTIAHVWDVVFLEGLQAPRALVEVVLAVLRICERDLLATASFADAIEVLKAIGARV